MKELIEAMEGMLELVGTEYNPTLHDNIIDEISNNLDRAKTKLNEVPTQPEGVHHRDPIRRTYQVTRLYRKIQGTTVGKRSSIRIEASAISGSPYDYIYVYPTARTNCQTEPFVIVSDAFEHDIEPGYLVGFYMNYGDLIGGKTSAIKLKTEGELMDYLRALGRAWARHP